MLSKYRTQWKSKQDKKLETLEHLLSVNYKSGHTSLKTSATQKNGNPQLTGLLCQAYNALCVCECVFDNVCPEKIRIHKKTAFFSVHHFIFKHELGDNENIQSLVATDFSENTSRMVQKKKN